MSELASESFQLNPAADRRLFVLDTNVLMHDPTALFRFQEHDIHLPMMVLEELDHAKKGVSEVARNVRQVSRFLDDLIAGASKEQIDLGLPLPAPAGPREAPTSGRLFFQTRPIRLSVPANLLPGNTPDHDILGMALSLRQENPGSRVTLVSKDINLRIKAAILGLHAEDYYNDQTLDDVNLLYSGARDLPADFWETHGKELDSWKDSGRTYYRVSGPEVASWHPNQGLFQTDAPPAFVVRQLHGAEAIIEILKDYTTPNHAVWGIIARNREQNFALNLLLDPEIDFVSLLGAAGTGKTLLALAAGLAQTLDSKHYREIIMTRVTVPVGEDIGFLPGTEEEKMTPWMGALMDNLEVLAPQDGSEWGRAATADLLSNKIKIRSLNFMRGRTFQNKYLIIDEAQNLTAKQMKTLITRAGPGTKVICLGNIAQIDTPYLSETTSGLTYVVDRFKNWPHGGHVTLRRGERSRLAEFASEQL
ncbi:MAG: PhoH family protein [Candidatus Competibacteraceae bacterium]|nr:PhoH family protein [Candidatus Competibacteraceae bacterium]MBK7982633.1 PhoH family protein [Candidatus Competibacteraceae bacterium]MBK8898821.1 PhoH family protein [Candidatus Competibacteraceae bacterium]MBK8962618.1 PhoH family protein [Candidatus Competibacteraceae bacterium]MBK9951834.1 PhoH family protein [Candidatus Competibacteraceae bacterium]